MENKDWDKINAQKRIEIALGQAKNQAADYMFNVLKLSIDDKNYAKSYKEKVRIFFKLNLELDDELLGFGDAALPPKEAEKNATIPEDYKFCPKCKTGIPKGFKFHAACGWNGE